MWHVANSCLFINVVVGCFFFSLNRSFLRTSNRSVSIFNFDESLWAHVERGKKKKICKQNCIEKKYPDRMNPCEKFHRESIMWFGWLGPICWKQRRTFRTTDKDTNYGTLNLFQKYFFRCERIVSIWLRRIIIIFFFDCQKSSPKLNECAVCARHTLIYHIIELNDNWNQIIS